MEQILQYMAQQLEAITVLQQQLLIFQAAIVATPAATPALVAVKGVKGVFESVTDKYKKGSGRPQLHAKEFWGEIKKWRGGKKGLNR